MTMLANVSLEMTPKPLFRKDDGFVLDVFRKLFRDWDPLLRESERISFLWWLSDGTDLLVYNRDLDAPIEWMFWQGFAHPTYDVALEKDPGRDSMTATPRIYRPDAVELTGADVRRIVGLIRQACLEALGREVRVGMAFDPGCEFSNHPFRYRDHPELLMGDRMKCIDCTARLHADPRPFAGFPQGLPEGTLFGRFFGRRARRRLARICWERLRRDERHVHRPGRTGQWRRRRTDRWLFRRLGRRRHQHPRLGGCRHERQPAGQWRQWSRRQQRRRLGRRHLGA